jgi:hypothetical protein
MAAQTAQEKARENRLRRMADRQGLTLHKPRRRDTRALDYGELWLMRYWVEDESGKIEALTNPEGSNDAWLGPFLSLDELEAWLTSDPDTRPKLNDRRAAGRYWLDNLREQAKGGARDAELSRARDSRVRRKVGGA